METIYRLYKNVGSGNSKDVLEAVMKNDCQYIINYIESGNNIHARDNKEDTLLHKACRNDNFEIIDLLIKLGIDVNAKNKYHETPLHLAVQYKNSEAVQKLLFEKANPNAQTKNKIAPLHLAASRGKEDILNILLNYGAKLNIIDCNGAKPIHHAVKSGRKEIIRTLLNSGASLIECDDRKNTVLHYACDKGDDILVNYILRHMTINNFRNIYKETPLHLAAKACTTNTLKLLLNAGYDLESKNSNGLNPIDVALANNNLENHDYLINYKESHEYQQYFNSTLHSDVRNNDYPGLVQKLNSSNINEMDYFGKSLLYYAIITGNLKMVKYLYENGANLEIVDEEKQSALLIAVYSEELEITRFLLEKGANVNEEFYGRTYLYRAILRNNYDMTKLLIDNNANVNQVDSKYRSIFSYALDYADEDIINLLIDKKAGLI